MRRRSRDQRVLKDQIRNKRLERHDYTMAIFDFFCPRQKIRDIFAVCGWVDREQGYRPLFSSRLELTPRRADMAAKEERQTAPLQPSSGWISG